MKYCHHAIASRERCRVGIGGISLVPKIPIKESAMSTVSVRFHDNIAIVRMNNGAANPISPELVQGLSDAVAQAGDAAGVVLSSGAKFFSIGLDLPGLLPLNRREMTDFWYRFNDLCLDIYTMQKPTACMLSGHAVAGGNILALTCDFRFASTDKKMIGLNEIKLGVPVPYLAEMILRQIVGDNDAERMMGTGDFMTFSDAKKISLVDETYPLEILEEQAIQKVRDLAAPGNNSFSSLKAGKVREIKAAYEQNRKVKNDLFLDYWFSDPVREKLQDAASKF